MSSIRRGTQAERDERAAIEERIRRVLDRETRGLVIVFDETAMDFSHGLDVVQVRDALLAYAREVAAYPGDSL